MFFRFYKKLDYKTKQRFWKKIVGFCCKTLIDISFFTRVSISGFRDGERDKKWEVKKAFHETHFLEEQRT